jgi:hypothetical protein
MPTTSTVHPDLRRNAQFVVKRVREYEKSYEPGHLPDLADMIRWSIKDMTRHPADEGSVAWFMEQWSYITQPAHVRALMDEVQRLKAEVAKRDSYLHWQMTYISSSKFSETPYVNTGDLIHAMRDCGVWNVPKPDDTLLWGTNG